MKKTTNKTSDLKEFNFDGQHVEINGKKYVLMSFTELNSVKPLFSVKVEGTSTKG